MTALLREVVVLASIVARTSAVRTRSGRLEHLLDRKDGLPVGKDKEDRSESGDTMYSAGFGVGECTSREKESNGHSFFRFKVDCRDFLNMDGSGNFRGSGSEPSANQRQYFLHGCPFPALDNADKAKRCVALRLATNGMLAKFWRVADEAVIDASTSCGVARGVVELLIPEAALLYRSVGFNGNNHDQLDARSAVSRYDGRLILGKQTSKSHVVDYDTGAYNVWSQIHADPSKSRAERYAEVEGPFARIMVDDAADWPEEDKMIITKVLMTYRCYLTNAADLYLDKVLANLKNTNFTPFEQQICSECIWLSLADHCGDVDFLLAGRVSHPAAGQYLNDLMVSFYDLSQLQGYFKRIREPLIKALRDKKGMSRMEKKTMTFMPKKNGLIEDAKTSNCESFTPIHVPDACARQAIMPVLATYFAANYASTDLQKYGSGVKEVLKIPRLFRRQARVRLGIDQGLSENNITKILENINDMEKGNGHICWEFSRQAKEAVKAFEAKVIRPLCQGERTLASIGYREGKMQTHQIKAFASMDQTQLRDLDPDAACAAALLDTKDGGLGACKCDDYIYSNFKRGSKKACQGAVVQDKEQFGKSKYRINANSHKGCQITSDFCDKQHGRLDLPKCKCICSAGWFGPSCSFRDTCGLLAIKDLRHTRSEDLHAHLRLSVFGKRKVWLQLLTRTMRRPTDSLLDNAGEDVMGLTEKAFEGATGLAQAMNKVLDRATPEMSAVYAKIQSEKKDFTTSLLETIKSMETPPQTDFEKLVEERLKDEAYYQINQKFRVKVSAGDVDIRKLDPKDLARLEELQKDYAKRKQDQKEDVDMTMVFQTVPLVKRSLIVYLTQLEVMVSYMADEVQDIQPLGHMGYIARFLAQGNQISRLLYPASEVLGEERGHDEATSFISVLGANQVATIDVGPADGVDIAPRLATLDATSKKHLLQLGLNMCNCEIGAADDPYQPMCTLKNTTELISQLAKKDANQICASDRAQLFQELEPLTLIECVEHAPYDRRRCENVKHGKFRGKWLKHVNTYSRKWTGWLWVYYEPGEKTDVAGVVKPVNRHGYYQNLCTGTVMWPPGWNGITGRAPLPLPISEITYQNFWRRYELALEVPSLPRFNVHLSKHPPTAQDWQRKFNCQYMRSMQWSLHRLRSVDEGRPEGTPPANVPVGSGNNGKEFHNILILYRRDATPADLEAMTGATGSILASAQVSFSVARSVGSEGRPVQDVGIQTSASKASMFVSDSASSALKKTSAVFHAIFIEFLIKSVISGAGRLIGKAASFAWDKMLGPLLAELWKGSVAGVLLSQRAVNGCIYYMGEASKMSKLGARKTSNASVYSMNWLSETSLSVALSHAATVISDNFKSKEGTLSHSIVWTPAAFVSTNIAYSIKFIATDVISTGCMMLSNVTSIASTAVYNSFAAASTFSQPYIAESGRFISAAINGISRFIFVTCISKGLWGSVIRDFFVKRVSDKWISQILSHDIFWQKLRSKDAWESTVDLSGTIWAGSVLSSHRVSNASRVARMAISGFSAHYGGILSNNINWCLEQSGKQSTKSWSNLWAASVESLRILTKTWAKFKEGCLDPAIGHSKDFSNAISDFATASYEDSIKPLSVDPAIKSGRYMSASGVWCARSVASGLKGSGVLASNAAKKLFVDSVSNFGILSVKALSKSASVVTSGQVRPEGPEWLKTEWNSPNFALPAFEKPE